MPTSKCRWFICISAHVQDISVEMEGGLWLAHVLFGFQEHIIKMQKQKMQLPPQPPPPQAQPGPPQQPAQVQVQTPQPPQQQQSPQLTTVTAPRPGALLTGTTVTNLQVARLVSSSSYMCCPKYHLCISPKLFGFVI